MSLDPALRPVLAELAVGLAKQAHESRLMFSAGYYRNAFLAGLDGLTPAGVAERPAASALDAGSMTLLDAAIAAAIKSERALHSRAIGAAPAEAMSEADRLAAQIVAQAPSARTRELSASGPGVMAKDPRAPIAQSTAVEQERLAAEIVASADAARGTGRGES
jgi:hypothetical protein